MTSHEVTVGPYNVSSGRYGVHVSNDSDDSSGYTSLTIDQTLALGRYLVEAAVHAIREGAERP